MKVILQFSALQLDSMHPEESVIGRLASDVLGFPL